MPEITTDLVLKAYAYGVFPMAQNREDPNIYWIDPRERGILPLDSFHIPRRLARVVRSERFEVRIDTNFRAVIEGCAAPAPDRPNTWINNQILDLFAALHEAGHAHSVECWRNGRLVGGLYGVSLGAVFFGESMFSRETDASKVALVHLVARLLRGSYRLLDTQFVTSHLARFGAIEIPRTAYQRLLRQAVAERADFYLLDCCAGAAALQEITHTS